MSKKEKQSTRLVLSGGLDSFVLAHKLVIEKRPFRGLYINFGKSASRKEIAAVKRLSLELNFPIDIMNLTGITDMQIGYIPDAHIDREADCKDFEREAREDDLFTSGLQVLLGIASYYAQITGSTSMTLGMIKNQFDKRSKLSNVFSSFESVVSSLNPRLGQFSIELPFSTMPKTAVVKLGTDLGAALEHSWSCLFGGDHHCGKCSQCLSRKTAFKNAKVKDPTTYEK